jgi:hypothetical protein
MLLTEAEAWVDFYLVAGASAAVLIGLLFVALSINREAIAAQPHFGGQARQAMFALVSIFVVSLIVLIPDQADSALGVELLCGALVVLVRAVPRQRRRMIATPPTERRRNALLIGVFDGAMLLIMAAGVVLVAGFDFALFLLAAAVIALSLLAIVNSWTLTLIGTEPSDR